MVQVFKFLFTTFTMIIRIVSNYEKNSFIMLYPKYRKL